jgi:hypothetical protein
VFAEASAFRLGGVDLREYIGPIERVDCEVDASSGAYEHADYVNRIRNASVLVIDDGERLRTLNLNEA